MKENIYRFWNKSTGKMIYSGDTNYRYVTLNGQLVLAYELCGDIEEEIVEDTILMQYSGMKDINGEMIFEGDILRFSKGSEYNPVRDSGGGIVDYDIQQGCIQLGMVKFSGASYIYETIKHLTGDCEHIHIPLDWIEDYLEVVGNVWENKLEDLEELE